METSESPNNTVLILSKYVKKVQQHFGELSNSYALQLEQVQRNENRHAKYISFHAKCTNKSNTIADIQNYVDLLCKEFEEEEEKEDKKCGGDGNSVAGEDSSYDSDYEGSEEPKHHDDVSRTVSDTLSAEFSEYVSISSSPLSPSSAATLPSTAASTDSGYISRVEFALKLGYTEKLVQAALQKLGPNPEQNELLAELIKLGAQTGTKLKYDLLDNDEDSSEFTNDNIPTSQGLDVMKLRPIVIDGSNVAMSHGNKEVFSCRGIKICVDWFRSRGHNEITVFVPKWRKETLRPDNFVIDQDILSELEKERLLVFTPSREIRGKRMVCYDDRYILKLAAENDGIVVSNDNYRDLVQECPEFRKVVEERILMYSFVNDRFMPPDDPLGRSGPTLDNFLKGMQKKADNCPYGKKCTYGNKCKYNHPERGLLPQKSITERLAERAQKQLQARNQEISLGKQLKGKSLSVPLSSTSEDSSNAKPGSLKKTPLARTKSTSSASRASDLTENKTDNYDSSVRPTQTQHTLAQSINTIWSSSQRNVQQWKHTGAPTPTSQPPSIPYVNVSYPTESAGLSSASSSVASKTKHSDWHASLDFPSSSGLSMVHNSASSGQRANIHRKLQRELSINPAYDSRLFQMQKYQQSASGPTEVSHQNLTRHYSFQTGDGNGYSLMVPSASHCSVTRIASAPSSNPPLYTIPHPAVINSMGASSSDSRLNVGLPNLQQSYNSTPPNWAATGIVGPPSIFGSTNVPVNLSTEEIRQKLRYHLASLFPENQVDTVMNMYPNESNPQKLCAAILTMFPARS